MNVGDKVLYLNRDKGIIKQIDQSKVWVVFNCGNDWDNYQNYTAALCNIRDLSSGWIQL